MSKARKNDGKKGAAYTAVQVAYLDGMLEARRVACIKAKEYLKQAEKSSDFIEGFEYVMLTQGVLETISEMEDVYGKAAAFFRERNAKKKEMQ